jgi:hypothetical protein
MEMRQMAEDNKDDTMESILADIGNYDVEFGSDTPLPDDDVLDELATRLQLWTAEHRFNFPLAQWKVGEGKGPNGQVISFEWKPKNLPLN